jgi:hypothetical protein
LQRKKTCNEREIADLKEIPQSTNWVSLWFQPYLMKPTIFKAFFVAVLFLLQNLVSLKLILCKKSKACPAAGQGFFQRIEKPN